MSNTDSPASAPKSPSPRPFSLRNEQGHRKYLTRDERHRFRHAADALEPKKRAFCLVLFNTGCRVSEALNLTYDRIETSDSQIVLETLKQRRRGIFRTIPISPELLQSLPQPANVGDSSDHPHRVWPYSRATGYRIVKRVMAQAGIEGIQACPKGLRHSFGVACAQANIPINLISRWLGHARLETTLIYLDFIGEEERSLLKRLWDQESH